MVQEPGETPERSRTARLGELGLLAALVAVIWLAASLHFQAPFEDRVAAGPTSADLPHLSVAPLPAAGLEWGPESQGPGSAFADAERLLLRSSVILLLATGLLAGLGQLALAGVVAVARRFEIRLRRAVGASRRRLAEALAGDAVRTGVVALGMGMAGAALASWLAGWFWRSAPILPGPTFGGGWASAFVTLTLAMGWTALAAAVVLSGEMLPGAPLSGEAALGEPDRGELCHPGVPVLQVALATAILGAAAALAQDPVLAGAQTDLVSGERTTAQGVSGSPEGGAPPSPQLPRFLVEVPVPAQGDAAEMVQAVLAALATAPRPGGPEQAPSLSSVGFWDEVGHVRYAITECGACWRSGMPPAPAPYKGEPAVHHAVSPDTFHMAGILLLEGRAFTSDDDADAESVAVVSEAFAREHFASGDAVGRRIRIGPREWHPEAEGRWHTVVGVIKELPRTSLVSRTQPPHDVLVPVAQALPLHLELAGAGLTSLPALPEGVSLQPLPSVEEGRLAVVRWLRGYHLLWLWAGGGAVAVALLGTALTVGRRLREQARELAVRRAVGATRSRLLVRQAGFGVKLGAGGAALGGWAALFAVAHLAPGGLGAPDLVVGTILVPALVLTLAATLTAVVTAALVLRGPPMGGFRS